MSDAAVWTNKWIRRLSWREAIKLKQWFKAHRAELKGIQVSRARRLDTEWMRRKHEGGGGMAVE